MVHAEYIGYYHLSTGVPLQLESQTTSAENVKKTMIERAVRQYKQRPPGCDPVRVSIELKHFDAGDVRLVVTSRVSSRASQKAKRENKERRTTSPAVFPSGLEHHAMAKSGMSMPSVSLSASFPPSVGMTSSMQYCCVRGSNLILSTNVANLFTFVELEEVPSRPLSSGVLGRSSPNVKRIPLVISHVFSCKSRKEAQILVKVADEVARSFCAQVPSPPQERYDNRPGNTSSLPLIKQSTPAGVGKDRSASYTTVPEDACPQACADDSVSLGSERPASATPSSVSGSVASCASSTGSLPIDQRMERAGYSSMPLEVELLGADDDGSDGDCGTTENCSDDNDDSDDDDDDDNDDNDDTDEGRTSVAAQEKAFESGARSPSPSLRLRRKGALRKPHGSPSGGDDTTAAGAAPFGPGSGSVATSSEAQCSPRTWPAPVGGNLAQTDEDLLTQSHGAFNVGTRTSQTSAGSSRGLPSVVDGYYGESPVSEATYIMGTPAYLLRSLE